MTAALEAALVKAREKLLSGHLSEAQVSQGPVRSILQALKWDTFDVDSVVPEYSVGQRHPEFALRLRNAKSRGKRAWIATSAEELFPGRPDFQGSEVTDVGAGWLVGTQMSAQVEMPKRVEAACACVGLIFGKDLVARFL